MNSTKFFHIIIAVGLLLLGANSLYAHEQGVSTLNLTNYNGNGEFVWSIALADSVRLLDLDTNLDSNIQWQEITSNRLQFENLINEAIKLDTVTNHCQLQLNGIDSKETSSGLSLLLNGEFHCDTQIDSLTYSFMENLDNLHVAAITLNSHSQETQYLIKQDSRTIKFASEGDLSFINFVFQGAKHILIGYDHLAFLLILFFSAHLSIEKRQFFTTMLLYVTNFTVAHTLTLIASSLNLIQLQSWLVESVIAGSVAYGAVVVMLGRAQVKSSTVFGFGLIHGLGFASVLNDLAGSVGANISLLLGFNLGVELGQMAFIIGLMMLFQYPLKTLGYQKLCKWMITPILFVSFVWLIERLFGISILS